MADIVITDRSRAVLSWGALVALVALVAGAVELRATVANQGHRLSQIETAALLQATKPDVQRVEDRVARIESLLLQQLNTRR